MRELDEAKALLDEINEAIARYDPVLKEQARDILLRRAFGRTADSARTAARRVPVQDTSLLDRLQPVAPAERALVGAYVLANGRTDRLVTGQAINDALKRHRIPVPNITRAIEANLRADPPLMAQRRKLGTTRQARKQYAITEAGAEWVRTRLAAEGRP